MRGKSQRGKSQQGVSLYLTIVILSVLTAALLTLITMSVSQIKVIWTVSDSAIAFYAADTGTEQALYQIRQGAIYDDIPETPLGEASYNVSISTTTEETIIKSMGSYKETRRVIEIRY